jgi:D-alanyl-D-alanine carboxypeptidase
MRRELKAARRRRRRQATLLALALAGVLGAAGLALGLGHGSSPARHTSRAARAGGATVASEPRLSPAGLPLARPAFELRGLRAPTRNPIQLEFKHPPVSGLLSNLENGQVLWQRDPLRRVHIASLTKMMTALLTVESAPPDARVLVTKQAVASGGSKVGVLPLGHHVRLETMLYGLMLPSGNDAAIALAQHIAGTTGRFVARMNERAAKLGMACTRYTSPSGYFDKGNFSCAVDLALLAHVDLRQPRIARVTHTYTAALPFPIKGGRLYLYNNNPLLVYHYPGTTGLKTGYTESAGRCLVATAERDGVELGVVLLNSTAPGVQAKQLLDRGFEDVYHLAPVHEPAIPPGA